MAEHSDRSQLEKTLDIAYSVLAVASAALCLYVVGEQFGVWRKARTEYAAYAAFIQPLAKEDATARRLIEEALSE